MPNHCHNDLYIRGPQESVAALLKHIGADRDPPQFDFNTVTQYPEQFSRLDKEALELGYQEFKEKYGAQAKDGFNSGGYEWRLENWGTKWNAYSIARRDYGGVCITFQTAWNCPRQIIQKLHLLFPDCTLYVEWFERGMANCGGFSLSSERDWDDEYEWHPGVVSREWHGDYGGHRGG